MNAIRSTVTAVALRTKRDRKCDVSIEACGRGKVRNIICARVNITSVWRTTITGENSYGKVEGKGRGRRR